LQEKQLQLYSFEGVLVREWMMDTVVRYIKVAGGPAGKEGLLVGLKHGAVLKIYVDNPFPIPLIKHTCSIRCVCVSWWQIVLWSSSALGRDSCPARVQSSLQC
jgi:intraflagellar transport protein 122